MRKVCPGVSAPVVGTVRELYMQQSTWLNCAAAMVLLHKLSNGIPAKAGIRGIVKKRVFSPRGRPPKISKRQQPRITTNTTRTYAASEHVRQSRTPAKAAWHGYSPASLEQAAAAPEKAGTPCAHLPVFAICTGPHTAGMLWSR